MVIKLPSLESVMIMYNIRRGDRPHVVTWHLKGNTINSDPDLI